VVYASEQDRPIGIAKFKDIVYVHGEDGGDSPIGQFDNVEKSTDRSF
jgi:hypothetical protein